MHQEHWQPEWEIKDKLRPFRQGQKPKELSPYNGEIFRTWLREGANRREAFMALRVGFYTLCS